MIRLKRVTCLSFRSWKMQKMLEYGVSQAWDSIKWNSRRAVKTLIPETRCYAFHVHYRFNHTHSCYRKKRKVKCLTGALSSGFRDHSAESAGFQTAMLSNDLYTVTADGCERKRAQCEVTDTSPCAQRILCYSPSLTFSKEPPWSLCTIRHSEEPIRRQTVQHCTSTFC